MELAMAKWKAQKWQEVLDSGCMSKALTHLDNGLSWVRWLGKEWNQG